MESYCFLSQPSVILGVWIIELDQDVCSTADCKLWFRWIILYLGGFVTTLFSLRWIIMISIVDSTLTAFFHLDLLQLSISLRWVLKIILIWFAIHKLVTIQYFTVHTLYIYYTVYTANLTRRKLNHYSTSSLIIIILIHVLRKKQTRRRSKQTKFSNRI